VQVDPAKIPYERSRAAGQSMLDIALATRDRDRSRLRRRVCVQHVPRDRPRGVSTTCNESTDEEEDQLDDAYGLTAKSRLACQCVPNGTKNIKVVVPAWNRNLAREAH
jgi:2Fe-2S ferredoxin